MPESRHRFNWLPIEVVLAALPIAEKARVSKVARGEREGARGAPPGWPSSFVPAYLRANGRWETLPSYWQKRRMEFVARYLTQGQSEGWWRKGKAGWTPTRRHLALVMWGYSPTPRRLVSWLKAAKTHV